MKKPLSFLFLFIGLRYAWPSGSRRFASFISVLCMLGITLGVAALIIVISVMNGLESELKERMLSSVPHAVVSAPQGNLPMHYDYEAIVAADPNVIGAMPQIADEIMIQSGSGLSGAMIYGIMPEVYPKHDLVRTSAGNEAFNNLLPNTFEVVIGSKLASALGASIGDKVRLISPRNIRYTPMGRIPAQRLFRVSGIFSSGGDKSDGAVVLANIEDVRRLAGIPKDEVSGVRFWLRDPFGSDHFISKVATIDPAVKVTDWRESEGEFFQSVAMEKTMMSLMLALIILVAAFNMFSALIMVVTNKIAEIAILRTMGAQTRTILGIFVVEGALSGVIGAMLGTVLGLLAVANIDALLSSLGLNFYLGAGGNMPCELRYPQVALVAGGTILLSFLITIYPSLKGAHMRPAQSLRYE